MLWEHNDCAVQAIAIATGRGYLETRADLEKEGRTRRGGTPTHVMARVIGHHGVSPARVTFQSWASAHQSGRYVVVITGHAFAFINGHRYDFTPESAAPRSIVRHYWRVA